METEIKKACPYCGQMWCVERMERVAAPVREDWFRLMRVYLAMDSAGVTQEQKRMRDAFNAIQCFAEEFAA